jgi:predicted regulator of Ras-like GTPase activity (Roadblock/LC7/MglB family)
MNEQGGFPIAILTDQHGFPLASAADPDQDPEMQATVVALVQKTAAQVQHQLGMAPTDEISMFDTKGRRLVCRPFKAKAYNLILAVLIPDKNQSYRRLTNTAVRAIRRQWQL